MPGIDALSSGIGAYNFGFNPRQDLSLLPLLNDYNNSVAQIDASSAAPSFTNSPDMPAAPTFDAEHYWQQAEESQDRMMRNSLSQQQKYNQYSSEINGPMYKINEAAEFLHDRILQDEQDLVSEALQAYINAYKEAYYQDREVDSQTLMSEVKTYYRNKFGVRLEDDLRNNSKSEFGSGFMNKASFGLFGDKVTAEENISKINNQPVSEKSRQWKTTGEVIGATAGRAGVGAIAGGVLGGILGSIIPGAGTVAGAALGAKIGALIGGGSGILSFFIK